MRRVLIRAAVAVLVALSLMAASAPVLAFRPFDGTDAAVADPGTIEIEIGPAGYLREGSERTLIAPATRLNYGFAKGWEAVLEGQAVHGLSAGPRRSSLMGDAVSLKGMLREESLQRKPGPSVAMPRRLPDLS